MKECWLICSGPSAAGVKIPRDAKVACVNGSVALLRKADYPPDFYLVGECAAAEAYADTITTLLGQGTQVFMRPGALERFLEISNASKVQPCRNTARPVDFQFGPAALHHLHHDVTLPRTAYGRPRSPWITSGVLMLWVLLEKYDFTRIVALGMDGYPHDPKQTAQEDADQGPKRLRGEYAAGVQPLASRPARTRTWAQAQNDYTGEAVDQLSKFYRGTEILLPRKPLWWRPGMRVTIGRK
ncbi:MAG: hypothetical protein ICCCNLDF_02829 [Planctomycetes bacterium]|nr:hypothetical protein [Planctomycetota bacterium]